MRFFWIAPALALLCLSPLLQADEAKKSKPATTYQVPYRLTETKHILVRAKINGKGPFHFIVDTGAPALIVSTAAAKKAGVTPDRRGWGTFDKFEIEGGVVVDKAKARIEDPFQLEGMNGLGLAGVHLDGMIGYTVLAKYRLEIDFTKTKMGWTPLDFEPPAPMGLGGGGTHPGLEAMGTLMKIAGAFLGKKAAPDVSPRGFVGIELADADAGVAIKAVLERSPAARAGLKAGDRITQFQGKAVSQPADVVKLAGNLIAGQTVRITFQRGKDSLQASFKAEGGL